MSQSFHQRRTVPSFFFKTRGGAIFAADGGGVWPIDFEVGAAGRKRLLFPLVHGRVLQRSFVSFDSDFFGQEIICIFVR